MAHRKVVVSFASPTGVPKDQVQNTFHFTTPTPSDEPSSTAELEAMRDAVIGFYDQSVDTAPFGGTGSARLSIIFHGFTIQPTLTIKIYRCETEIAVGASPEPIISYTVTITAFATANVPLPTEVAICLSYKGVLDTSIAAARQRGRIFLGPLQSDVVEVVTGHSVMKLGYRALIAAAGAWLRDFDDAGVEWVVWSTVSTEAFPVAAGWVDNAFDTQRRRGTLATVRTVW